MARYYLVLSAQFWSLRLETQAVRNSCIPSINFSTTIYTKSQQSIVIDRNRIRTSSFIRYTLSIPNIAFELYSNSPPKSHQLLPGKRNKALKNSFEISKILPLNGELVIYSCQENYQCCTTPYLICTYGSWRLANYAALCRLLRTYKLHGMEEIGCWSDENCAEKIQGKLCRLATNESDVHYSKMRDRLWTTEKPLC